MYLPALGGLAADPLRANSPMSMDLVCRRAVGVADNREEELCEIQVMIIVWV